MTSWGGDSYRASQDEQRRATFARRLVEHRCRQIVAHGTGGRNGRCFAAARNAARLCLSGVLDWAWAEAEIVHAGITAGLTPREAQRAVSQGQHYGQQDGEWTWE